MPEGGVCEVCEADKGGVMPGAPLILLLSSSSSPSYCTHLSHEADGGRGGEPGQESTECLIFYCLQALENARYVRDNSNVSLANCRTNQI